MKMLHYPLCTILLFLVLQSASGQRPDDFRNFNTGSLIPDERYCDQPYIVRTKDGNWLCTLTTGQGGEGGTGQHIVATISKDKGKTWSPLIPLEPADGPEASYCVPLVLPNGRVYVFYNYNGDKAKTVEGVLLKRPDLGGWYVFKYSDDNGLTWSSRYRMPMPLASVDRDNNPLNGKFQLFWSIDKPDIHDNKVYLAITRMRKPINAYGEGWLYTSSNILTEADPAKLKWDLYPADSTGIRQKEFGSLQEEHNIVPLSNGNLLCFYRTRLGFACQSYSKDGGKTWSVPEKATYTPGGQRFKTPMACPQLFKLSNNRYLFWYHNTASQVKGPEAPVACRNLGWVAAGTEKEGVIHWSQPELVNYCPERRRGCSYPDIVEEGGRYFLASTNKDQARVQELDAKLINNLLNQEKLKKVVNEGLLLSAGATKLKKGQVQAPALPDLSTGAGFSIELRFALNDLSPGQVLLDARDATGKGWMLETGSKGDVQLNLNDGATTASWNTDSGLIRTGSSHQVTFIVDGGPKLITAVVDGHLCDGGDNPDRLYGYGRFFAAENSARKVIGKDLADVTGGKTLQLAATKAITLQGLRIYNRYLTTSEAISNYRAGW